MTAGFALFLFDAFAITAFWPLAIVLVLHGAPDLWSLLFAVMQLGFLYALGLYRKDSICGLDKTLRRIPMVVGLSVAASSLVAAILGLNVSVTLCVLAFGCFTACAAIPSGRCCRCMTRLRG